MRVALLLGVLLLTVSGAHAQAARDPLRFIDVHVWHGQATVTISGSKTSDGRARSVDRRFSTEFKIEMPVGFRAGVTGMTQATKRAAGAVPPAVREAYDKLLAEVTWLAAMQKRDETLVVTVHDRNGDTTLQADPAPVTRMAQASVKMNLVAGTYDLRVVTADPIEMTATTRGKVQKLKQRAVRGIVEAKKQPLPTDKDVLTGRIKLEVGTDVPGLYLTGNDVECWLEWTLSPTALPELELEVDIPDYATWLPEGHENGTGLGAPLAVKATLQAKGGGTLVEKCVRIAFHLVERSAEPGSAMNAPAAGDREPDLRFDAVQNPTLEIRPGGNRALANHPGLTASAKISPRDFGAYGVLTVSAYTDLGRYVEGTTALQPGDTKIRIPKRARDSKIADAWKPAAVAGQADDADADHKPAGDKTDGDGLTLYEEYRGFFVAGRHVRTDPEHKDLFVLTHNHHAKVKDGVLMFEKASGLKVHLDTNEQLLNDRRVNYNFGTGSRGAQHGIVVQDFSAALSKVTYARRIAADGGNGGTPKDYLQVEVAADMVTLPPRTASWSGTKVTGPDPLASGLAHELAHCTGVVHHGDDWDYDAVWQVRRIGTGSQWAVTEVANGVTQVVTVIREDGKPYPFSKEADLAVTIGVLGGVDSGAWDCLMRYTNASAYVLPSNRAVRVDIHGDEICGTSLCTSRQGTGSNDAARAPYSRFGDARKGNCLGQVRVKDW